MSTAAGPGEVLISHTQSTEAMTGDRRFQHHVLDDRQVTSGAPFVIEEIAVEDTSGGGVQDGLFPQATRCRQSPGNRSVALQTQRINDTSHIRGIDHP